MGKLLWKPSQDRINNSNMKKFIDIVNTKYKTNLNDFAGLHNWSVENISEFWKLMWDFVEIKSSQPYTKVIDDTSKMPGAKWFEGAKLNFAENLLRFRNDNIAIIYYHKTEDIEDNF